LNLSDEKTLQALKLLEKNPELTQRELAVELGISLGKTHYMVKALIDIGWIKLDNFQRSNNKWGYAYLLTPMGLTEKAAITVRFLARKQEEYRRLERQIADLSVEVASMKLGAGGR
jgi:EPS-associated MarR family transcriptional regulator